MESTSKKSVCRRQSRSFRSDNLGDIRKLNLRGILVFGGGKLPLGLVKRGIQENKSKGHMGWGRMKTSSSVVIRI